MNVPPPWLPRLVTRIASALAKVRRKMMPPPFAALDLGTMSWVALGVSAFCELGLPDELARGPRTAAELARDGFGNEAMLFRLLRALAAYDVVRYTGGGRFALGHAGHGLTGADSVAPMVLYANADFHVRAYARLGQAVRTGKSGMQLLAGMPGFGYLAEHPQDAAIFDAAMQSLTPLFAPPLAAAYDFSRAEHLVDVGGGTGMTLAAVLARHPNLRATLFDLPDVVQRAREAGTLDAFADRISFAPGDMFESAPPEADAYLFAHILHDWDDASCTRMLANVRRAMKPDGRVLIFEIVAPPPNNRWSQDRITDLEMMAMLSGRERTREEFEALLATAKLRIARIVPAAAPESVIEAIPQD